MPRYRKGSPAAKRYMAQLRAMRRVSKRRRPTTRRRAVSRRSRSVRRSRPMAKRKTIRRRRTTGINPKQLLIGGALATVAEPFIDQLSGRFASGMLGGIGDDVIKLGIGYMMAKKMRGYGKGFGMALMLFGARNVVSSFVGGGLNILAPQTATAGGKLF